MLDLWDKRQVENSLQSDDLNARINKIEKFMKLTTDKLQWKWDSETEEWIISDEQHNETEKKSSKTEPLQIENMPEATPEPETIPKLDAWVDIEPIAVAENSEALESTSEPNEAISSKTVDMEKLLNFMKSRSKFPRI